MAEAFDPYHKWLGIAPQEQPPNHYRLLGLRPLENDPDVIESAADQRMAHLRSFQAGKHSALSQKVLNEVAAARVCLLNPRKKAAYDQALQRKLTADAVADEKEAVDPELIGLGQEGLHVSASRVSKIPRAASQSQLKNAPLRLYVTAGAGALLVLLLAAWLFWPSGSNRHAASLPRPAAAREAPARKSPQAAAETSFPERGSRGDGTKAEASTPAGTPSPGPGFQPDLAKAASGKPKDSRQETASASSSSFIPRPSSLSAPAPPPAVAPFDADQAKKHQEVWAKYLGVPVAMTNSVGMKFVLIPPGDFEMGTSDEEIRNLRERAELAKEVFHIERIPTEGPRHHVRITMPVYLGQYEVTQGEYTRVADQNPSGFRTSPDGDPDRLPAENMSWSDIKQFCERLTSTPQERDAGRDYRLPSEAEWEYACRAGTMTLFHFGDDDVLLKDFAWFGHDSSGTTHPVGQKRPNAWGLYDMHGNVWEWCGDCYERDYYQHSPGDDPQGAAAGGYRPLRGGVKGWNAWCCRSAFRDYHNYNYRSRDCGFRLVCAVSARQGLTAASAPPSTRPKDGPISQAAAPAPESTTTKREKAPPAKKAVPDEVSLSRTTQAIRDTYKDEYEKADSPAAKSALAKKMIEQAGQTQDDDPGCYALLRTARAIAVDATDIDTAFDAASRTGKLFQVDPLELKQEILTGLVKKARSTTGHKTLAERTLEVIDEGIAADQLQVARQLVKLARSEAQKARDKELVLKIQNRQKQIDQAEKALADVVAARKKLQQDPKDAEASLVVGRYLCFLKGDWKQGLPLLAAGSDETLKAIAQKELSGPQGAEAWQTLGDGWWEIAETGPAAYKPRIRTKAVEWYYQALPFASAALKKKLEIRIQQGGLLTQFVNPIDGSTLVLIPPGKFLAGEDKFPVELAAYYIGLTEVTNEQYKRFVSAAGYKPGGDWRPERCTADRLHLPALEVNWNDAQAYCAWAGLRLPTELEWEKGARGFDGRTYPWGDTWIPGRCCHATGNQVPPECSVLDFPDGRSPWGLYQMCGNAWEWCADWYESHVYKRYQRGDLSPPSSGTDRVQRGESRWCHQPKCTDRRPAPTDKGSGGVGFRVARSSRP